MVTYLTGPVLSLILIALAGIALRYAFWYRAAEESKDGEELIGLRGETVSLRQEVSKLCEQNECLKHALTDHENNHTHLRDDYDQLQREYEALKDASRQRELASQTNHEESYLCLRNEYDQLRHEYEALKNASRQLEIESQTNHEESYQRLRDEYDHLRRAYDALHDASQQLELQSDRQRSSVADIEETLQSLRDDLAAEGHRSDGLRTELESSQAEISQLRDEVDSAGELRLQLDASWENCRELQQALDQSQESIARLEVDVRFADALRDKQTSLQQALQDNTQQVQNLTRERDDLAARLVAADGDATQLRDEIALRNDRIKQLEERHEDVLRQHDQERLKLLETHQELQATLAETQSQLTALNDEKESVTSSLLAAEERVSELDAYIAELIEDVSRNEGVARQLRIEKEEALTRFERGRNELETTIITLRAESDDLQATCDGMSTELEQARESCRTLDQELRVECANHTSLIASLRAETAELRDAKESANATLERERSDRVTIENSARDDIAHLRERIDAIQLAKQAAEDELQRKMSHFMSVESVLRCEMEELRQEKENTIAELTQEQGSRQQLEEALRLHSETLDRLRADSMSLEELRTRQSTIHDSLNQHANQLRVFAGEPRAVSSNRTSDDQSSRDSSPVVFSLDDRAWNQQATRETAECNDDVLGVVYGAPPSYQDDLKLISGIGEILEKRLNELGVYTYEQIMNWNQEAIHEFSTRLAFKDRIESDEWVEQARRLHDERYGRAAA